MTSTKQEMQMCMDCSPHFDKGKHVLAHEIGLHVFVHKNGGESVGNDKYITQQRATRKEALEAISK